MRFAYKRKNAAFLRFQENGPIDIADKVHESAEFDAEISSNFLFVNKWFKVRNF